MSSEHHEENAPFQEDLAMNGHGGEPAIDAPSEQPGQPAEPAQPTQAAAPVVSSPAADALALFSDIENKMAALRDWQQDHEHQVVELTEWTSRLNTRSDELAERERVFEESRAEMDARSKDITEREGSIAERFENLERDRAKLDEEWARLGSERDTLAGEWEKLNAERDALAGRVSELDGREAGLNQERESLDATIAGFDAREAELAQRAESIDHDRAELDEKRRKVQEDLDQISEEWRQIDLRRKAQDQLAETLGDDRRRIDQLRHRLNEEAAERGDAAAAEAQAEAQAAHEAALAEAEAAAQRRAQELTDQLEALRGESSETIEKLTSRVSELEREAAERGEAMDAEALAAADDLRRRLEDLGRESDQTIDGLKARIAELEEQAASREQDAPDSPTVADGDDPGHDAEASAGLAEREASIVERERELDRRRHEIQEKLSAAKDELSAQRQAFVEEREAFERMRESFEQEAKRAEESRGEGGGPSEIEEAVGAAAAAGTGGGRPSALRISRLKAYRAALRARRTTLERDQAKLGVMHKQYASLLEQRKVVLEVKDYLEASESVMVQRWAAHRAITLVASVALIVAAVGASSYKIAEKMAVQTWRTASVFAYTPATAGDAEAALDFNIEAARSAEKSRILSEPVLNETLSRLQQQGLRPYTNAGDLREFLSASMTLSAVSADRVRVALVGEEPDRLDAVLGSLGRAVALYHQNYTGGDEGEQTRFEVDVVEATIRDADPVSDDSLVLTGQFFGMGMGGAVVIGLLFWAMLRRSGRVLETAEQSMIGTLSDDAQWPSEESVKR